jgi:hypothetical protein
LNLIHVHPEMAAWVQIKAAAALNPDGVTSKAKRAQQRHVKDFCVN